MLWNIIWLAETHFFTISMAPNVPQVWQIPFTFTYRVKYMYMKLLGKCLTFYLVLIKNCRFADFFNAFIIKAEITDMSKWQQFITILNLKVNQTWTPERAVQTPAEFHKSVLTK